MKILNIEHLHINDCAAVGALISLKQKDSVVIKRKLTFYDECYKEQYSTIHIKVRFWIFVVLFYLIRYKPKYIWLHSALFESKFIIPLKRIFRYSIIYWSHGTDLRNKTIPNRLFKCDLGIKSTNSVSHPFFNLVKLPIDKKLFYPSWKIPNTALYVSKEKRLTNEVQSYCNALGLKLKIIYNFVPHEDFASLIRKTHYYIEHKGFYPERSKTYYEAEQAGCDIIESIQIQKKKYLLEQSVY